MKAKQHQRLLREQKRAYRKLNAWEAKERHQRLPSLSSEDALMQFFQLIALSKITADKNLSTNKSAQIKRWQERASLIQRLQTKP